jgi:hypothetical protein
MCIRYELDVQGTHEHVFLSRTEILIIVMPQSYCKKAMMGFILSEVQASYQSVTQIRIPSIRDPETARIVSRDTRMIMESRRRMKVIML